MGDGRIPCIISLAHEDPGAPPEIECPAGGRILPLENDTAFCPGWALYPDGTLFSEPDAGQGVFGGGRIKIDAIRSSIGSISVTSLHFAKKSGGDKAENRTVKERGHYFGSGPKNGLFSSARAVPGKL